MQDKRYESVVDLVEDAFSRYAELPAFTSFGHTLTFKDVDQLSSRFASYLQHQTNLQPGDRIAIQLPNIHQYPVVLYGAIRAGLVVVNTNPLYTPRELQHQLQDSGARALVVFANVASNASQIIGDTQVEYLIVTELGDLFPPIKRGIVNFVVKYVKKLVPEYSFSRSVTLRQAFRLGGAPLKPVPRRSADDLLVLQYTGGTTGVAKGAMLSHGNLCANVQQVLGHMSKLFKTHSQVVVAALPFYHIFAFNLHALCAFAKGGHNILIPNPRDVKAFVKAIKPYKVSTFIAVNTLYNALVRDQDFAQLDFSELKTCAAGGMAVTEDVAQRWHTVTGCQLCEGYGLTETSPVIITNPDDKIQRGTVGTPLMDTEIQLIDSEGNPVAEGEIGEITARGPQVMLGYWQRPEATNEVMLPGGWFKTGDMGVRRADGYFKIVDRKKDMILVSGFNVYPNEVEDVISQHPAIVECAVIGVPHPESGEAVKLFVVADSEEVTKEDIIAHSRKFLTGYKVPKLIEYVDSLPKSNVGKILRRELREQEKNND